jgi:hypothetical protein
MNMPQEIKADMPAPSPQRRTVVHCWLSLFGMVLLAVPTGIVLRVDIWNNYTQGTRYLHELGLIMAVAAIAYAVVPMVAAVLGRWCWMTIGGALIAGGMTMAAAYLAYTNALNAGIASVLTVQAEAETARSKRQTAQADLEAAQADARIPETMSSSALKLLYDDAVRRKGEESKPERGGCKPWIVVDGKRQESKCVRAEREAGEYLHRMGQAEARERAEERAKDARERLAKVETVTDAAPATQELAAVDLAMRIDATPEEAARLIARGLALLSIALTVIMGLLMHRATELGMQAFAIVPLNKRAAKAHAPRGLEVVPPAAKPTLVKRAATLIAGPKSDGEKRGRKPMTAEQRVKKFAADRLIIGVGQMTGDVLIEAFNLWWCDRWPEEQPLAPNKMSTLLQTEAGVNKRRSNGKSRYEASLTA